MRSIAIVLSAALLSSAASAAPAKPIDLDKVPNQCRSMAKIPPSARTALPALSARVSVASCISEVVLADGPLTDDDASIQRADAVMAPAIATLDEVIAKGDPTTQIIAEYTKGDLLSGLEVRLRRSIPEMTARTSVDAAQALEQRHRALEPKLEPWAERANAAFRHARAIAQANPAILDHNPVVQYMVRAGERVTE